MSKILHTSCLLFYEQVALQTAPTGLETLGAITLLETYTPSDFGNLHLKNLFFFLQAVAPCWCERGNPSRITVRNVAFTIVSQLTFLGHVHPTILYQF